MSDPAALNGPPNVPLAQVIRIASRLIAAYLLLWALDDLTALPREVLGVAHYLHAAYSAGLSRTGALDASYLLRTYILDLAANTLRIALWLMADFLTRDLQRSQYIGVLSGICFCPIPHPPNLRIGILPKCPSSQAESAARRAS